MWTQKGRVPTDLWLIWKQNETLFFSSVVSLCAFLLKVALLAILNHDCDFIIVGFFFAVSPCLTEDVIVSVSYLMPCLIWTYYATMPLV